MSNENTNREIVNRWSDEAWDKFFDFIYNERDLSDDEVREELRELGIDTTEAVAKVKAAIEQHNQTTGDGLP